MPSLTSLTETFRLHTRLDSCGDKIVPGKRGHLWVDAGKICLMLLDAPPVFKSRLHALINPTGKVWQGDASPNSKGRIVQDAKVFDIAEDKVPEALRIAGIKRIRQASPEIIAQLERIRPAAQAARKLKEDRQEGLPGA